MDGKNNIIQCELENLFFFPPCSPLISVGLRWRIPRSYEPFLREREKVWMDIGDFFLNSVVPRVLRRRRGLGEREREREKGAPGVEEGLKED